MIFTFGAVLWALLAVTLIAATSLCPGYTPSAVNEPASLAWATVIWSAVWASEAVILVLPWSAVPPPNAFWVLIEK